MASIEVRKSKSGLVTYAVKWREGGRTGKGQTFTFADVTVAETFRDVVNAAGNRMPTPDQLAAFGLGDVFGDGEGDETENIIPLTVAGLCDSYLDYKERGINPPMPRTMYEYRRYVELYIRDTLLGAMFATDATFRDVDAWQLALATTPGRKGKPISKESILKVRSGVLYPAFDWACSPRSAYLPGGDPLLRSNPCAHSEAPRVSRTFRRDILESVADFALVLGEAYAVDTEWAAMLETVMVTGQRWGEIAALQPGAVDRRARVIHLEQRLSAGEIAAGTKNGRTRPVPVPDVTMARAILPRLDRVGTLFIGPAGNRWSYATEWDRWNALRDRLKAAGFDRHITHHCLRHSYNTWLLSAGIPAEKLRIVMGHVTGTMTDRYTQLTAADLERIRAAVAPLVA